MSLRDHLQAIYLEHGRLTPELVVQAARPEDHPLHTAVFDRAVKEAAEAWYTERAHELISSVRIIYRPADELGPERSVRAFHALRLEDGYSYEPAEKIANDEFMARLLMGDMEREWTTLRRRYEDFEEFWRLVRKDVA